MKDTSCPLPPIEEGREGSSPSSLPSICVPVGLGNLVSFQLAMGLENFEVENICGIVGTMSWTVQFVFCAGKFWIG